MARSQARSRRGVPAVVDGDHDAPRGRPATGRAGRRARRPAPSGCGARRRRAAPPGSAGRARSRAGGRRRRGSCGSPVGLDQLAGCTREGRLSRPPRAAARPARHRLGDDARSRAGRRRRCGCPPSSAAVGRTPARARRDRRSTARCARRWRSSMRSSRVLTGAARQHEDGRGRRAVTWHRREEPAVRPATARARARRRGSRSSSARRPLRSLAHRRPLPSGSQRGRSRSRLTQASSLSTSSGRVAPVACVDRQQRHLALVAGLHQDGQRRCCAVPQHPGQVGIALASQRDPGGGGRPPAERPARAAQPDPGVGLPGPRVGETGRAACSGRAGSAMVNRSTPLWSTSV